MKKLLIATGLIALCSATAFANSDDVKTEMKKMCDQHFKMSDTNSDGKISADENEAIAKKMFSEADTNGDKMISKDEQQAMFDKQMSEMKNSKSM